MKNYICKTCGTEFNKSESVPIVCPICEDERQFEGHDGQQWTTLEQLKQEHKVVIKKEGEGVYGIGIEPSFAIGQRALLIETDMGNILWDCIPLIDDKTIEKINELGGVTAIAISHPHFYSGMVQWSRAFGGIPIYLHRADLQWIMRNDPAINFWDEESKVLSDQITLIKLGGHFDGATVLHRKESKTQTGALFSGDVVHVTMHRNWVSFMYSFPNLIPLSESTITAIVEKVSDYRFEEIYGAWFGRIVKENGNDVINSSAKRYLDALKK